MRIRQIVFAALDLAASRHLLAEVFQMPEPFRDPGVAEFGIDNAVFTFGDQFIEVISPVKPDTACGRHLQRQGDSGYMLLVQTDNLARERERFTQMGVRSVWSTTFDDISAMHLHPKDVGGAIVSVDEPLPAASWRWGGPGWQVQPGAQGQQRVRGITLRAADPMALAKRWAQVLARPAPELTPQGWRVGLIDGFADFEATPAGSVDGVAGFTLAVVEPQAVLARAAAAGLPVQGASLQLLGARIELEGV
jgi:hypothetical protein